MNATVLVLLLTWSLAEDRHWTWNFESDATGSPPSGFYFDETGRAPAGRWRVVQDGANKVLAQLDRSKDRNRYALAVVAGSSLEDLRVSVRMRAVGEAREHAGGLMWRYKNSENYLVARLDVAEKNVRLYRFVRGNRVQFGVEKDLNVRRGQWYTLRVEHRGRKVKVYLDDEVLFIERDRHFRREGKIGLWTQADSVIQFDDLQAIDMDDDDDE